MWDIVWVSPQGHRSVSVSRHFLLQAPQCPCSVRKRFSRDHCCRGRSKPGCRIVGSQMYECHVFKLHLIWFSHTQKTIRRRPNMQNIPIPPLLSLLPSPFYPLATKRPHVPSLPVLYSRLFPPLPPFHSLLFPLPCHEAAPCPLLFFLYSSSFPLLPPLPSLPFPSRFAKFSFSRFCPIWRWQCLAEGFGSMLQHSAELR